MGDIGDTYQIMKEESQKRRAEYRRYAPEVLRGEAGLVVVSKNAGAHLIVKKPYSGCWVDFWPGTGLWIVRLRGNIKSKQRRGRGIRKLLTYLEITNNGTKKQD